jgi:hypothetical protein
VTKPHQPTTRRHDSSFLGFFQLRFPLRMITTILIPIILLLALPHVPIVSSQNVVGFKYIRVQTDLCTSASESKFIETDNICNIAARNVDTSLTEDDILKKLTDTTKPQGCILYPGYYDGSALKKIMHNSFKSESTIPCSNTYPCICQTSCPVGTYQNEEGMASCKACGSGLYNDVVGASVCKACSTGRYNAREGQLTADSCYMCLEGTVQDQEGQTSCKDCAVGTTQSEKGQSICNDCPSGKYNDQVKQFAYGSCKKCPVGQYQDDVKQIACKVCQIGMFSSSEGASECSECPAGRYNTKEGGTDANIPNDVYRDVVSGCVKCSLGKYSEELGQSSSNTCQDCPVATYGAGM